MAQIFLVVGTGCSGTSATAGVLDKLGVPMGRPDLMNDHPVTGFPLYEDSGFYGVFKRPVTFKYKWLVYIAEMARENKFGLKNTEMTNHLDWVIPYIQEQKDKVKVIVSHRQFRQVVRGRMDGKCPPNQKHEFEKAMEWGYKAHELMYSQIRKLTCPVYHVQFESLLKFPEAEVAGLAQFVFQNEKIDTVKLQEATAHIKR